MEIALSQIAWNDNNLSILLQGVHLCLKLITFPYVKLFYLIEWVQKSFIYCLFLHFSFLFSLAIKQLKEDRRFFFYLHCLSYSCQCNRDPDCTIWYKSTRQVTQSDLSASVKCIPALYNWVFQDTFNYESNDIKIKTLTIREISFKSSMIQLNL